MNGQVADNINDLLKCQKNICYLNLPIPGAEVRLKMRGISRHASFDTCLNLFRLIIFFNDHVHRLKNETGIILVCFEPLS